jgi:hypothetical protein
MHALKKVHVPVFSSTVSTQPFSRTTSHATIIESGVGDRTPKRNCNL